MIKKFMKWIGLKEKLHSNNPKPPLVNERDLWWISIGENIGSEINGKSELFSRPGIILKKLSHSFYLIAPTTTQDRKGSWYVEIKLNNIKTYACLHQIRVVDYRRLSTKLGRIDSNDFLRIRRSFNTLYK